MNVAPDEGGGFVPDRFIVDEVAQASAAGFASPSDSPPRDALRLHVQASAAQRSPAAGARRVRSIGAAWIVAAAIAVGLFMGRRGPAAPRPAPDAPHTQAMRETSAPAPADPATVSASAPASAAPSSPPVVPEPVVAIASAEASPAAAPRDAGASDGALAKRAAQRALERGKVAQAIDLGEHAVEVDPTDAESWLILGAAYLERGSFKEARRCFSSCLDQATHGPKNECAALRR